MTRSLEAESYWCRCMFCFGYLSENIATFWDYFPSIFWAIYKPKAVSTGLSVRGVTFNCNISFYVICFDWIIHTFCVFLSQYVCCQNYQWGILLQVTDHLLFGESEPASFALKDKLLTRITLLYIGTLVSNNLCHHEWTAGARAINYMSLVSPGCLIM